MERFAVIRKIKPGMLEHYTRIHSEIWDDVVREAHDYHLRNFSIFHHEGYLFMYFEYIGSNYEADMEEKNNKPIMKKWQKICNECFDPVEEGTAQIRLKEIFHNDF